jgi:Na+-driven multidrug efflux pump
LWLNAVLSVMHVKYNTPTTSPPSARWLWWFDGVASPASMSRLSVAEALDWGEVVVFLRLGLPGILGMSEWWMWEAFAFMAGQLGTKALAAHSVAYNYIPLVFMIPLGVSIGQSVRVATLLGQGEIETAKQVAKWSTVACLVGVFTIVFLMYMAKDALIRPFSTDVEVHQLTVDIWGYVCIQLLGDSTYGVLRGTIIGLGLQSKMGLAILVSLWLVGLPVIYHSTFGADGKGLIGLWSSLPIGYWLLDVLLLGAILTTSWTAVSDRIRATTNSMLDSHSR